IIDGVGVERGKQIDTRGRLLREFVGHLIRQRQASGRNNGNGANRETQIERDLVLLLGEIVYGANSRDGGRRAAIKAHPSAPHHPRPYGLEERVLRWVDEYRSQRTSGGNVVAPLAGAMPSGAR